MLFSSADVAQFIDATFEPAWETVRPVPVVTIDFGNGHKITRTLHGNVATYVCFADGGVLDVLPGIYTPGPYKEQLGRLAAMATLLAKNPDRADKSKAYHARQLLAPPKASPQAKAVALTGGAFKGGVGGFQASGGTGSFGGGFSGGFGGGFQAGTINGLAGQFGLKGGIEGPLETTLANRPELALDTQANETVRRRLVHEKLAKLGAVPPGDLKKWLFKEVLKTDLDDPTLGVGAVLNANYPFAEEDRAAAGR